LRFWSQIAKTGVPGAAGSSCREIGDPGCGFCTPLTAAAVTRSWAARDSRSGRA